MTRKRGTDGQELAGNADHVMALPQIDKAHLFLWAWNLACAGRSLPAPEPEYVFAPPRKWRFDWAWPFEGGGGVAVEVDGNAWRVRGGGRHGTDKDKEKGNRSAQLGWLVFHFSPEMLTADPLHCAEQVAEAVQAWRWNQ